MGALDKGVTAALRRVKPQQYGYGRAYDVPLRSGGVVNLSLSTSTGHPTVSWSVHSLPDGLTVRDLPRAQRVRVGKEAMGVVAALMKRDAKRYRPSAYEFWPTDHSLTTNGDLTSRKKLYAGMLERELAGSYYEAKKGRGGFTQLVYAPPVSNIVVDDLASTLVPGGIAAAAYFGRFPNRDLEDFYK